jgi:hypothetical protein
MKSISFWAKGHPWPARCSIVLIKFSLIVLAVYTGTNLSSLQIILPPLVFPAAIIIFFAIAFLYPGVKEKLSLSKQQYYLRQKTCDLILALTSFIMICSISNTSHQNFTGIAAPPVYSSNSVKVKPTAEEILASLKYREKSSLTRTEKKILKKEFKKQLVIYGKAKLTGNADEAGKAGLTIVAIIAALGLLYLLAALSCSLSCSGNDGAAIVVGLVGLGAIIWLLIIVLKKIHKKKNTVIKPSTTGHLP